jgi:hypothetical protein
MFTPAIGCVSGAESFGFLRNLSQLALTWSCGGYGRGIVKISLKEFTVTKPRCLYMN